MEQIKEYNDQLIRFGREYRDILSKTIFDGTVFDEKDQKSFFKFLDELNFFPLHIPYSTEILRKYSDSVICSYRVQQEEDQSKFITVICQKSKFCYPVFSLCFFNGGKDSITPYINVDIFSDNVVKEWVEFVEDNEEFEDYSLIESSKRLGL